MDRKQSVIANVRFQTPKGKGASKLNGLLRYIQYRDDRDGHIPQERGLERWVDHGLGRNFREIAANCETLKSDHVQAFTFIINPNPDLIQFVPEAQREVFVKELTETGAGKGCQATCGRAKGAKLTLSHKKAARALASLRAPSWLQRAPDSFKRCKPICLHVLSMTPEPICKPSARYLG